MVSEDLLLSQVFATQRQACSQGPNGYGLRMQLLETLRRTLRASEEELLRAVSGDFGGRSREETLTLELFALYSQVNHARRHLKSWMRRKRVPGAWFLQPAKAFYQYQPLGVVGVIGTWNYPILLTLGPVVDALAAGNRVMLKPSEMTPATGRLIAEILSGAFPPEQLACVTGDREISKAFARLPFDHLFFTGSAQAGRQILESAAANLTPVTLELGGKSPAIVHEDYPLDLAVKRIMVGKLYNAGQTCVAPDYVLIPEGRQASFESFARRHVKTLYPKLVDNSDYTRIINRRQYQRLSAAVEEAASRGARVVPINPASERLNPEDRVFPPTLIFEPANDMTIMAEEIFGPVLPVLTYRTLEEAIGFVNARPHPLALYYFDNDSRRINDVLRRTRSGGVTINDCIFHLGQPNLPFGGVGQSGMGHYHGFDGFVTFSKKRGVMVQPRWSPTSFLHAPFGARTKRLIRALLKIEGR